MPALRELFGLRDALFVICSTGCVEASLLSCSVTEASCSTMLLLPCGS